MYHTLVDRVLDPRVPQKTMYIRDINTSHKRVEINNGCTFCSNGLNKQTLSCMSITCVHILYWIPYTSVLIGLFSSLIILSEYMCLNNIDFRKDGTKMCDTLSGGITL